MTRTRKHRKVGADIAIVAGYQAVRRVEQSLKTGSHFSAYEDQIVSRLFVSIYY